MWWVSDLAAVLYLIVLFTLGLTTLRNGHGWMFFFGILPPRVLANRRLYGADETAAASS